METGLLLHILRNEWGASAKLVHEARQEAADRIEAMTYLRPPINAPLPDDVAELQAIISQWRMWGDYASRRYREETGKDLQAAS